MVGLGGKGYIIPSRAMSMSHEPRVWLLVLITGCSFNLILLVRVLVLVGSQLQQLRESILVGVPRTRRNR